MMRDQELASLAMTLGRDAKIKITVSGDGSYCKPDGSHINIARMPSTPLGRMLMTGLVFHEIGHKNHTKGNKPEGLLGDMMNVIEDIRVDLETIKARPGTRFNLEAVTTHYVNKGSLEPDNLAHALLGKVMAYGYGTLLKQRAILPLEVLCNEMMEDAFGSDFVEEVEAIIQDIPKLRSTRNTIAMAQKLIDLLINQPPPPTPQVPPKTPAASQPQPAKENQEPPPLAGGAASVDESDPQQSQAGLQSPSEEECPTGEPTPTGGQSHGEPQSPPGEEGPAGEDLPAGPKNESGNPDQVDEQGQAEGTQAQSGDQGEDQGEDPAVHQEPSSMTSSQQQQEEGEGQQASASQGQGAGSGGGKRPTPEEIAEMLKNQTGYGDLSALIQSELDSLAGTTPSDIRSGIPMLPVIGKLKATNGKLNEVEAISASSKMRAKMMGSLQSIKRQPKSYGLSGRKLAPGRLIKMATGDPRIFTKKIEVIEINTAVTVLLDLSGSMGSKYQVANAAAFALHTTLFGLKGVAVCSMEFSGKDRKPEINVLVDFGRKPQSENFNHFPFDGTPTHNAIWAGRVMLLQRPEPRKIMLILTDGCPDSDYETKAATTRALKDGIEIAAIGIEDSSVRRYWDNHRVIKTIQELPAAMFGIMEGLLIKQ